MKEESVNVLDSLDGDSQSEESQGERESQKEIEKKVRENLRAEYERKANEKIEAEKASIVSKYESRIAELEGKNRLTSAEDKELKSLEQKVYEIETNPEAKPWDLHMERLIEKKLSEREQAIFDRQHKADQPKAVAWVNDKAKELKIEAKELENELLEIMEDRWLDDLPSVRVQKAYAQLQKFQYKYSGKKEEKEAGFVEGSSERQPRKISTKQALDEAKKSGNWTKILAQTAQNQEKDDSRGAGLDR